LPKQSAIQPIAHSPRRTENAKKARVSGVGRIDIEQVAGTVRPEKV
jgi:hypothetical protein